MNLKFLKLLISSVFFFNFSVFSSKDFNIDYHHLIRPINYSNSNVIIDFNKGPMSHHVADGFNQEQHHAHASLNQNNCSNWHNIDCFKNNDYINFYSINVIRTLANINMPILVLALLELWEKKPICTMDAKKFKLNLFAYFAISITETFRYIFFSPEVFNENYITAFYFAFSFFLLKVFSNNKLNQVKFTDLDMV